MVSPLVKLSRTRPYSVRKRLLAVAAECGGMVSVMARVLGIPLTTLLDMADRVGVHDEIRDIRAERVQARRAAHQLAWSLHGRMYEKTDAGREKGRLRKRRTRARARAAEE